MSTRVEKSARALQNHSLRVAVVAWKSLADSSRATFTSAAKDSSDLSPGVKNFVTSLPDPGQGGDKADAEGDRGGSREWIHS